MLMRSDELYKFSDGTLTRLRTSLDDITKNIRMEYMPQRRWSALEKKRAHIMIKAFDKFLTVVSSFPDGQVEANTTCSNLTDIYKDIMKRPLIMAFSNLNLQSECTAKQAYTWTEWEMYTIRWSRNPTLKSQGDRCKWLWFDYVTAKWQNFFDPEIKKIKVKECYFLLFLYIAALQKEKEHIQCFAAEFIPRLLGLHLNNAPEIHSVVKKEAVQDKGKSDANLHY
ncbi:hypothetical protein Tco_0662011 [Tanacetum coccineum]